MKRERIVKKKKILIVDDEIDACDAISSYLKRKGFATKVAHNGREALQILQKIKPHLIILDVVMPIMDGFEFLQYLKAHTQYCKIPVIMLTVKSGPKQVEKGISLETDFYLPKPFTFNNLMNFINIILKE